MNKLEIGQVRKIGNTEFIILDINGDNVICLSKDFVFKNTKFDENTNNFAKSTVFDRLNGNYLRELEEAIGAENIIEQEINLIALNGSTEYGKVKCKVGLITQALYVKYRDIIKQHPVDDWWWTATPSGTKNDGNCQYWLCCLLPGGYVFNVSCNFRRGVRAFCTFKSNIFESQ